MRIKQITFDEALELVQKDVTVYVIKFSETKKVPSIKLFDQLIIGDMMKNKDRYIFSIVEEV